MSSNQFNPKPRRRTVTVLALSALILLVAVLGKSAGMSNAASATNSPVGLQQNAASTSFEVRNAVHSDTSAPLSSIKPQVTKKKPDREENEENTLLPNHNTKGFVNDAVVQTSFGPLTMPGPIMSWEGMNFATVGNGWLPDTNGDVGPNNYVQMVNSSFQIWGKSGNSLYGPADINTLWQGFGGLCQTTNNGDPVVLYDPLADRWMLSQFAFPDAHFPTYECIAISTTSNPTGSYHRYAFLVGPNSLADYPHFGVWPDGYYMTTNDFSGNPLQWAGQSNYAFERTRMLTGDPNARMIVAHRTPAQGDGGMLPSDLDGNTPPPAGSPNYFLELWDGASGVLHEFKFHVDWANPASSTFTGPISISVQPWNDTLCQAPRGACIDQPNTSNKLDGLNDRFMNRVAYRNMGSYESLLTNHSVNANGSGRAGVRWYEIRNPNGTPTVFQQSTYSPSADHRWLGSIAMDRRGNIALGYSVSSTSVYPSIRYAGRLVTDPPNQLAQGEGTLIAGGGSATSVDRWGDYANMSVDPVDDCTFWFTTEYLAVTEYNDPWQTRIGSFKFPSCNTVPVNTPTRTPTITLTPAGGPTFTPTVTLTPVICQPQHISANNGVSSPTVIHSIKNDVSPPLRDIARKYTSKPHPPGKIGDEVDHLSDVVKWPHQTDPVVQKFKGPFAMPAPILNFDGVDNIDGVAPPDTNGDVGLNDYMQWVNSNYQIYSKTDGTPRLPNPVPGNAFWRGFGGVCQDTNHGDPLMTYDSIADRWLVSQFAFTDTSVSPYHQCLAVSTTSDPTGSYNRYDFVVSQTDFNDYGKQGVWPDAYYQSYVRFTNGSTYAGQEAIAFDRARMLQGQPATAVMFTTDTRIRTLLPADLDGTMLPPAGAPNVFAGFDRNTTNQLDFWNFHVDFTNPNQSSFTGPNTVTTAPFNTGCEGTRNCIPQPGTSVRLDGLTNRLMYRNAYRNLGNHEAWLLNHSVDAGGGQIGVRWYEVRGASCAPGIYQQGTYAPNDGVSRWMGSIAMDHTGNIAVGYSVSDGTSIYPGIRYAGRLASDPLGQLAQGETTLITGGGSQTSSSNRWGDYSAMQVDPTDDCTFWYTTEYYATTSARGWQTRIGSFKFPSCSIGPTITPTPTFTGTPPTNTPTFTISPTPCSSNYTFNQSTGASIVPGMTDTGNHTDDGTTAIALPFTYNLYGMPFTSVNASSNGNLQFNSSDTNYASTCLPYTGFNYAILPHWDDLRTDGTGVGIYTSISGNAPNRIFNIEWRACLYVAGGCTSNSVNFEVRLYEGQNRFDIVYGAVAETGTNATVGVQKDTGSLVTQFECNNGGLSQGLQLVFTQAGCATVPPDTYTPTRTITVTGPTNTPTRTITVTGPTNTPTRTITVTTNTNTPTNTITVTANGNAFHYLASSGPITRTITVSVGSKFTLDLYVNSDTNTVRAQQTYLTFTNSILQNVRTDQASCVPTNTITADLSTFDDLLRNDVCNGTQPCTIRGITSQPGSIAYLTGARLNDPAQGDFHIARVAFCANTLGDAVIHWQFSPPDPANRDTRIIDADSNTVSNRNLYVDYIVHVVPGVFVGHVNWQGRPAQPNTRQQVPITLTLKLGNTEINYPVQNTDSSGSFTVNVGTLPNGTYNWRVKSPKFLANVGTVTLTGASTTQVEMGLMKTGDANNDNVIDITDYGLVIPQLGRSIGDPGYDARADFNGDNTIDITDYGLLVSNIGALGGGPLSPDCPTPKGQLAASPTPPNASPKNMPLDEASLVLVPQGSAPPNGGTVNVGDRFVLELWINGGTHPDLRAQQAYVTFTNQLLQNARVSSIGTSCVPTNTVTADLTTFDDLLRNDVCNGDQPCTIRGIVSPPGSIAYLSGARLNDPSGGNFRVAQIGLCAIAPGQAIIHWQFSPPAPANRDTRVIDSNSNTVSDPALFTDYVINIVGATTTTPIVTPTNTLTPVPASTFTNTPTLTNTPTITLTPILTSTRTNTPTNTFTNTPTATLTPVLTNTPSNTPTITRTTTNTPTNTPTYSPTVSLTPNNTFTNTPTHTRTNTPTVTLTPNNTVTYTPTNTPTLTLTLTRTNTPTHTRTNTPAITLTPGSTSTITNTPLATLTGTTTPTKSPTATETAVATATATAASITCEVAFSDVASSDYFYTAIRYFYCRGVISGYLDGTFGPYNDTTRGQLSKIIVLALGWRLECPSQAHFDDVPVGSVFYCFVETAYSHGIISGYDDGTFRPENNVSRGQLSKIIVLALHWTLECPYPAHFDDVPVGSVFYCFVETAYSHGIISGYNDGTFHVSNNAVRGQIAVIIYRALGSPPLGGRR